MTVCQKLGVILESKVVQKLSLEKMFLIINGLLNWYSQIIFFETIFLLFFGRIEKKTKSPIEINWHLVEEINLVI